jgi:hypothetical protein
MSGSYRLSTSFFHPSSDRILSSKVAPPSPKVHRVIERFSEDVDVTYDIRELAPDETAKAMKELDVIPESRSQQSKLSDLIREKRLPQWIENEILPLLRERLSTLKDSPSSKNRILSSSNTRP